MDTVRHELSEIDEENALGYCSGCQTIVKLKPRYNPNAKTVNSKWRCKRKFDYKWNLLYKPYRLHKKEACEKCGFSALHPAQLHVDHIDGDNSNNDPENLQTLCANCHAYKTAMKADWKPNKFSQSIDE